MVRPAPTINLNKTEGQQKAYSDALPNDVRYPSSAHLRVALAFTFYWLNSGSRRGGSTRAWLCQARTFQPL